MARRLQKKHKQRPAKSRKTCGRCRDCNDLVAGIAPKDWHSAFQPRCPACGGLLDRIGDIRKTGKKPVRKSTYGTAPKKKQ